MRFTKIPLIATLMAVALSLLIVLPGLAQSQDYDDTRGMLSSGDSLTVEVLDNDEDVAGSYFNGTLYVSNAGTYNDDGARTGGAYNQVRITAVRGDRVANDAAVDDPDPNAADDDMISDPNAGCVEATVRNNRSGRSIKVQLPDYQNPAQTNVDNDNQTVFEVIAAGDESAAGTCVRPAGQDNVGTLGVAGTTGKVAARHGDTLTITVKGVSGSIEITVDADGPEFSEISPEHKTYLGSRTVKFRFVATDGDSGLAHDGELDYSRGDADARAINGDDDNFTSGEPRTALDSVGEARDIDVMFSGIDQSAMGTSGWRQRGGRPGVSYFLDMAITNQPEGPT